jgi:hypothetical protein
MGLLIGMKVTLASTHYLMDGEAYLAHSKFANNKLLTSLATADSTLDLVDLLSAHNVVMPGTPGKIMDTAYSRGTPVYLVKFEDGIQVPVRGELLVV